MPRHKGLRIPVYVIGIHVFKIRIKKAHKLEGKEDFVVIWERRRSKYFDTMPAVLERSLSDVDWTASIPNSVWGGNFPYHFEYQEAGLSAYRNLTSVP